jgi:hypothetical protein
LALHVWHGRRREPRLSRFPVAVRGRGCWPPGPHLDRRVRRTSSSDDASPHEAMTTSPLRSPMLRTRRNCGVATQCSEPSRWATVISGLARLDQAVPATTACAVHQVRIAGIDPRGSAGVVMGGLRGGGWQEAVQWNGGEGRSTLLDSPLHERGELVQPPSRRALGAVRGRASTRRCRRCDPAATSAMLLDRMAGVADGVRDELTRVTTPSTGGYYLRPLAGLVSALRPPLDPEDRERRLVGAVPDPRRDGGHRREPDRKVGSARPTRDLSRGGDRSRQGIHCEPTLDAPHRRPARRARAVVATLDPTASAGKQKLGRCELGYSRLRQWRSPGE